MCFLVLRFQLNISFLSAEIGNWRIILVRIIKPSHVRNEIQPLIGWSDGIKTAWYEQVTTRHQPISLDMKGRLQAGLPCVWSGGRRPPAPATLSLRSPAGCVPLSCRLSSSASPSFCSSFWTSSTFSSSTSLWASPRLSSGPLSEPEITTPSRSGSAEGGCRGPGGSEPAEKEGGRDRDDDYFIGQVAKCNQTLKSFIPRRDIHHLKSVTKLLLTWK